MAEKEIIELDLETAINDNDNLPKQSTSSGLTKRITWALIKSTLKTYFDGIYQALVGSAVAGNIATLTAGGQVQDSGVPVKDAVAQYENNVSVIDGDFNFNSSGSTSQTVSGYDVFDMWEFDFSGATGTLSLGSHESTSSKPYYASIDITTGDDAVRFRQKQAGNKWSEKTLSVFIRAKYTSSAPTSLTIQFRPDGGSSIFTGSISGLTTSWSWLRVDVEVPAYTVTEYTELRLNNQDSEVFDLDIDKIRIEPTNNLQAGEIPSWLDNDDDIVTQRIATELHLAPLDFGTSTGGFNASYITTDSIYFTIYKQMIDNTATLLGDFDTETGFYVTENNTTGITSGFSFSVETQTENSVTIKADKTSHGLSAPILRCRDNSFIDKRY